MPGSRSASAEILPSRLELEIALLRREVKRLHAIVRKHERAYDDLRVQLRREVHRVEVDLEDDEEDDLSDDFDRDELGDDPEEDA
jgi:hypothetical protein